MPRVQTHTVGTQASTQGLLYMLALVQRASLGPQQSEVIALSPSPLLSNTPATISIKVGQTVSSARSELFLKIDYIYMDISKLNLNKTII